MAITIFLLTIIFVIWQPRGLGIGFAALAGALLALATGVVTLQDIPTAWAVVWNGTFTFIALVVISLILNEAGFFQRLALWVAHCGIGRGHLLFLLVVVVGALITAVFTKETTAFIWTPIVLEMLLLLGFSSKTTSAFIFATGFIADTASAVLPVSNLVTILCADYFKISFLRYVLVMVPVSCVAIATSLGILWFYFNRHMPPSYSLTHLPPYNSVIRDSEALLPNADRLVCQWSFPILGFLLIGYFLAQPLSLPVSLITGISAFVMLALAGRWFHRRNEPVMITLAKVWHQAPWQMILLTLGIYLVTIGLHKADITKPLSQWLEVLSGWGLTLATISTGFLATVLSGLINNLPAVLINASAIQDATGIDPAIREGMVYANLIGCTVGSKITPIGSLSTLLWLNLLAGKKVQLSWVQYVAMTLILTVPVLFISLLSLAIWLPWLIA